MLKCFYRPVTPWYPTQLFGANKACVSTDGNNRVITCDGTNPPEGYKSLYGPVGHKGIDLMAKHGQEVYCALTGVVDFIDTNPKNGLDIRIISEIGGRKFKHIYEHLLGYQGKKGDAVLTGQLVGWADNTGWSSADHLHFEVQEWLDGKWVSIDPIPLMYTIFAKDWLRSNEGVKWASELLAQVADRLATYLRDRGRR